MRHTAFGLCALILACTPPAQLPRTSGAIDLVIATTTDVHGRLRAWDYYANRAEAVRGLTRAATIVDSVRAANPGRVILLDAGDLLQGNPLAYVAARVSRDRINPIIAAMNAMRYDAAAIGNHEYNYGVPYLDSAIRQAKFPFLSANTYRVDPEGIHAYKPWTIVERAGLKIGIVGATTPGVAVWDAENIRGRLRFGDIVPAVRQAVQEVRAAGAEIVLVTVHSGLNEPSSYDTVTTGVPSENVAGRRAAEVQGIDLVLYGHSHKEVRGTTIGTTLLIQPKNWATSVNIAHLLISRTGRNAVNSRLSFPNLTTPGVNDYTVVEKRSDLVQSAGHAENPAVLAATDAAHLETVAYVTTPIGTTPERWSADSARVRDTPLIDFILETEREAAGSDLASTAAFSTDLVMGPGPITIAQVAQLYPYDNTLRAVRISGKQLREYIEFSSRYYRTVGSPTAPLETDPQIPGYNFDIVSGVDYTIDVSKPIGSRVTRLDYKGAAVRDTDTFTMALNNYRQTGGGGYAMLSGAPVVYDKQQEIRQLLIDEVKRRGVIRQADYFKPNWMLVRGDANAASRCCQSAQFLRIVATNDFHGALEPRPDANGVQRGGAAYVGAAIDQARKECAPRCEALLLDAGDLFQGTLASNLSFGRPVVDYYNRMGYAAAALGNHEFDWGIDSLRARMRQAKFGIFGANVRYTDGRDVKWIRNDTIVTRGRTKIGIIGISTVATPTTTRSANVVGLRFDDPAPIVDSIGTALRKRGANVIVVIAHAGAFCGRDPDSTCNGEIIDLAHKLTTKVDAIVSGHTHSLVNTVVKGIPIVQARSSGRAIDVLDLPIDSSTEQPSHEVRELASDTIKPLASIDSIVQRAIARVASLVNRHITTIPVALARQGNQYPLGNLIADAQRWAGKGDVAIMNNGGIRTDLRAGDATYGSLFELQPFGNTLYSLTMAGAQLRGLLEAMVAKSPNDHVSGLTITYDPSRPAGSRIVSVTMADGTPLSDARRYNVIMNDFLATGGEGYNAASRATASRPLNIVDLDALIDYLRSLPAPIAAPTEVRIKAVAQ
jgi:2',3'-cyclic-nucleotide 2'-phosphodiesterase (5'-nucleotidase family)